MNHLALATVKSVAAKTLNKACVYISINDAKIKALVDSGSSDNFIHLSITQRLRLKKQETSKTVSMEASSFTVIMLGYFVADIQLNNRTYENAKFFILQNLCVDMISGQDWQKQHESRTTND